MVMFCFKVSVFLFLGFLLVYFYAFLVRFLVFSDSPFFSIFCICFVGAVAVFLLLLLFYVFFGGDFYAL